MVYFPSLSAVACECLMYYFHVRTYMSHTSPPKQSVAHSLQSSGQALSHAEYRKACLLNAVVFCIRGI